MRSLDLLSSSNKPMRIYSSDSSFTVGGQNYEGFPILVDSTGAIVEAVLLFFVDELLGRSGAQDIKTWETYARHIYDYFGYLENRFAWDHIPAEGSGDVAPLAHYVRWCASTVGNQPGYINDKRATVERFYEWALRVGRIHELPFTRNEVISFGATGRLSHISATRGRRSASSLYLREPNGPVEVLSRSQIDIALEAVRNPTHRAQIYLGLTAGLRSEELSTFPTKYVVDCSKLPANIKTVPVTLDPADMSTKNDKRRSVRVSVACMNLLWQYREVVRPRLRARAPRSSESAPLFLTRYGVPFENDGLVTPLSRLGIRVGFHIHPHMLRHTFATHTLASLEELKHAGKLMGSPLVIVQRLLGHEQISTTSRYLHLLDSIEDVYGTRYQAEIDALASGYQTDAEG